jgi:hypothetical protein
MCNLSFVFFKAIENRAFPMIFGAKYVADRDHDAHNIGISLTERKVVV